MPSHQHICAQERFYIWQARREGRTQEYIAEALGRHPSTICRELNWKTYAQCHMYTYYWARHILKYRKQDAKHHKHNKLTDELAAVIELLLRRYLSPEQVSRYIHLNPVKAKLASKPEAYLWSSYALYLRRKAAPAWLKVEKVLSGFKSGRDFHEFVLAGSDEDLEAYDATGRKSPVSGSDAFRKRLKKHVGNFLENIPE